MCVVLLNGEGYNVDSLERITLSSFLEDVRSEQAKHGRFISDVCCDGVSLNIREEEDMGDLTLNNFDELKVTYSSPEDIIFESLQNNDEVSATLSEVMIEVSEKFRLGVVNEVVEDFIQSLEHIEAFLQIVNHIRNFMEDQEQSDTVAEMENFIKQFLEISNEMLEAQNEDDYVLLADLLEYEVVPLLQDWENISGQIRKLLAAA